MKDKKKNAVDVMTLREGEYAIDGDCDARIKDGRVSVSRKWQPGDILKGLNDMLIIFKGFERDGYDYSPRLQSYASCSSGIFINREESGWRMEFFELAPEEDRERMRIAMRDAGYEWDKENKLLRKVGKKKWKPKAWDTIYAPLLHTEGEFYFFVGEWVYQKGITLDLWDFPTKEECEKLCGKLNRAIESIRQELINKRNIE